MSLSSFQNDVMFVNVYFPCLLNLGECETFEGIMADLSSVIIGARVSQVVLGGDYNFKFNSGGLCQQSCMAVILILSLIMEI